VRVLLGMLTFNWPYIFK